MTRSLNISSAVAPEFMLMFKYMPHIHVPGMVPSNFLFLSPVLLLKDYWIVNAFHVISWKNNVHILVPVLVLWINISYYSVKVINYFIWSVSITITSNYYSLAIWFDTLNLFVINYEFTEIKIASSCRKHNWKSTFTRDH